MRLGVNKAMFRGIESVGVGKAAAWLVYGLGWVSGSSQESGEVDNAWGFLLVDGHGLFPQVLGEFLTLGAPTIRGGPASGSSHQYQFSVFKGANLLSPLRMSVISLMEFFIRGSDGWDHAKPPTLLHRPTKHEFGHLRDGTPEVLE